jgi:hypothetical protein
MLSESWKERHVAYGKLEHIQKLRRQFCDVC